MFALSRCAQRSPLPAVKSSPSKKRAKRKSWFTSKRRLTVCHLSFSPKNPKNITNKSKRYHQQIQKFHREIQKKIVVYKQGKINCVPSLFFSPMFSSPTNLGHTAQTIKTITMEISKRHEKVSKQTHLVHMSFGNCVPICGAFLGSVWPLAVGP